MPYRVFVVDGRVEAPGTPPTWKRRMELPFISGSWERKRNGGAGGQVVVPTQATEFEGTQRLPVWPWQSWIVIEWKAHNTNTWHMVYAGVITEAAYDWAAKKLTLSHTDIWQLWAHRIVTTDRTNTIASSKVAWSGLSAGTLIKRIVQNATSPYGSPMMYAMPMVYPSDAAGTQALDVYGYSFEKASDLINDIITDENGPDIDFRPRWSSNDTLEWVLEVNANKRILAEYNLGAEQSNVLGMTYRLNGAGLCEKMYGAGEGSERRTLVRQSDNETTEYLAMEDSVKFSSVTSLTRLQSMTTAARQARDGAIRQTEFTVFVDNEQPLNALALGGSIRWYSEEAKDPWLLSGWHELELIGFSGSLTSESINLTTQEMEGRAGDL